VSRSGEKRSETFRANQRPEQVDEKAQRDDSNNDVFHGSDPIEGIRIANAQGKEADDCQHENEIHHEPMLLRLDAVVVETTIFFPGWRETPMRGPQIRTQTSCREYWVLSTCDLLMVYGVATVLFRSKNIAICPKNSAFCKAHPAAMHGTSVRTHSIDRPVSSAVSPLTRRKTAIKIGFHPATRVGSRWLRPGFGPREAQPTEHSPCPSMRHPGPNP
jgi:hypothetical protein